MTSYHYQHQRFLRENIIKLIGYGNTVKEVVVDRGHRNGPEIHQISSTGIITIYNQRTNKLITKLIAQPNQIKRYYQNGEEAPQYLIDLAREHKKHHFNNF